MLQIGVDLRVVLQYNGLDFNAFVVFVLACGDVFRTFCSSDSFNICG